MHAHPDPKTDVFSQRDFVLFHYGLFGKSKQYLSPGCYKSSPVSPCGLLKALKVQCCTCLTSFHGHVLLILVFLLAVWFNGSLFFQGGDKKKHPRPGPSVLFGKSTGLLLLCFTCCQPQCALRNCGCLFRGEKKIEKENWLHLLPPSQRAAAPETLHGLRPLHRLTGLADFSTLVEIQYARFSVLLKKILIAASEKHRKPANQILCSFQSFNPRITTYSCLRVLH